MSPGRALGALVVGLTLAAGCDYDERVPATGSCDELTESFVDELYEPLLSERCVVCHREGGLAASSALVLARGDDDASIAHNLAVVTGVARKTLDGESVLLSRPSGRHPAGHTGGALVEVDSDAYRALERFVAAARTCVLDAPDGPCDPELGPTGPRLLRRLSRDEWARSVEAVLGVEVDGRVLAPDDVVDGFDNQASALGVSALLADQLRAESERLARLALTERPGLVPCDLASAGCPARFVRELGLAAFRRPLTDAEVAAHLALYEEVSAEDGAREAAIWVVTALLQSPHFLYRSELGVRAGDGRFVLTGWERASALSYAVWGGPPDEALMRRAAAGELDDPTSLASELARMLEDPRADATLAAFGQRWLGIDRLPFVTRDASTYPELTPEIRADMAGEAARLLVDVAARGGSIDERLTARDGFMTDRLADFYGVARATGPADAQGFRMIDLSATPYGGLLRLGAVLTTHALPQSSSPIHRGKMVRERLLCEDLPPPPSNLDTSPPPIDPTKSTRERYAEHAANEACASCHDKIDPIGFGLERFDGIGRFRETDGPHPIDDTGEVIGLASGEGAFVGANGLAAVLVDSPEVDRCWLVQRMRYALGYDPPACLVDDVAARHATLGATLGATLPAILGSGAFVARSGGDSELDSLAVGAWDFDDPPTDPVGPVGPGPTDPPTIGSLAIDAQETSRWDSGYCFQVAITNVGDAPSGWVVERAVEGTIDNLWSARAEDLGGGRVRFGAVDWNATLYPGAGTTFGFCAKL
ncbi:MAG: DUF1592 domain-containing protein [Deltaproteobacteria bacterium]|nr:DUF1592 domain-containing protein [Deltaproteobacteria bacterium]